MEPVFAWTTPDEATSDEVAYWRGRTVAERVSAVEIIRQATLGIYDDTAPRLERVYHFVEPTWRALPDRRRARHGGQR